MYLKEIQLENFKSFGRRMTIPFLEGFTAITGPNGSGKSNIADAILFVLGPRSSKAIRAGRLTDLLYNGGKSGRAAKQCKVTLVFDNSDRLIPLDEDEVRLTRVVKLSESNPENYYSYFYVNGRPSSLNEFNDLLANAKISADGYNFIQQGDVNAIVRMSPVERRRILEDVAGITKFDRDIENCEAKRAEVEENLKLIDMTLSEIRSHLRQLEKDRMAALKYLDYKARLERAKALMAYKRKEVLETDVSNVEMQIGSYMKERDEFVAHLDVLRHDLRTVENEIAAIDEEIAEKGGDEAKELKDKIDVLKVEIARAKDAIMTSKSTLQRLKEERALVESELKKASREMKKLERKRKVLSKELVVKRENLEAHKARYEDLKRRIVDSDKEVAGHQRKIISINRRMEETNGRLHAVRMELELVQEKAHRKDLEIAHLEERCKTLEMTVKDARWRLKDLRLRMGSDEKERAVLKKRIYDLKKEETRLETELEEALEKLRLLDREYTRLKTEAEVIQNMQSQSSAVEAILDARDRGLIGGIHGTVAELSEVEKEYEVALSVAAGRRINAIVVNDDTTAEECIKYLKSKNLGRAAFLPLNKMMPGKPKGRALIAVRDPSAVDFAIKLVRFDDRYRNAFWWVFGDTVVMKDLKSARRLMGGVRMVTVEGELIEASGAMIGGTIKEKLTFGSRRRGRIERVAEELRNQHTVTEELRSRLLEVRTDLRSAEKKMREIAVNEDALRQAKELEIEEAKALEERAVLEQQIEAGKRELREIRSELDELAKNMEVLEEELKRMEEERASENKALMECMNRKAAEEMSKLEDQITVISDEIRDLESNVSTLDTQISLHAERVVELETRLGSISENMDKAKEEGEYARVRLDAMKKDLAVLLDVERSMLQEIQDLRDRRDRAYERKVRLEKDIDTLTTKIQTHGDVLISLKTRLAALQDQLEEAMAEVDKYDIELPDTMPPLGDLKAEIADCEANMRALEPVNMRAIEDYEVQDGRRKEIEAEYERLEEQRKHLINAVREIVAKKKDGLLRVFEAVKENFTRIYRDLSVGGEGILELENPENPFEGGLIIRAKPPNKRSLRLGLLSGGEKSLTALALIFAIQEYDPSPFYVLDEVDMFLDAINAERVAKLLVKNSERAQFIVITLRRVTIKEADHVYGVTMEENGVSELIGNVHISQVGEKGEILKAPAKGDAVA